LLQTQQLSLIFFNGQKLFKFHRNSNISTSIYFVNRQFKFISILFRLSTLFNLTVLTDCILYDLNYSSYKKVNTIKRNFKNKTASLVIFNQLGTNFKFMCYSVIKAYTISLDYLFLNAY